MTLWGHAIRGAAAGAAGTAALHLSDAAEEALLGRPPVYRPARVARRLLGSARWGGPLRWSYGPFLGGVFGALAPRRPSARWGFFLGAAVLAFELWAMPRTGATPALRRWRPEELLLLVVHTQVYGHVTVAAAALWADRPRRPTKNRQQCGGEPRR